MFRFFIFVKMKFIRLFIIAALKYQYLVESSPAVKHFSSWQMFLYQRSGVVSVYLGRQKRC